MLRPDTIALTALLALLTALGPLAVDMYLPSFPDIGRLLSASPATVQLTLSLYMVAYAVGQIAYGPISDRLGRIPAMRAALAIYCVASLACALAPADSMLRRMPPHRSGSQLAPSWMLYALLVERPFTLLLVLLRDAPTPMSTSGHSAARAACVAAVAWRTRAS